MPANTNPIFIADRRCYGVELDPADTTNPAILVAAIADGNGTLIEAIAATSTDTSDVEIDLILDDGTDSLSLGSVTVPAGAGTDGGTTPAVDVLNQTDLRWLRDDLTIALGAGWTLEVAAQATITAATAVHITAFCGEY